MEISTICILGSNLLIYGYFFYKVFVWVSPAIRQVSIDEFIVKDITVNLHRKLSLWAVSFSSKSSAIVKKFKDQVISAAVLPFVFNFNSMVWFVDALKPLFVVATNFVLIRWLFRLSRLATYIAVAPWVWLFISVVETITRKFIIATTPDQPSLYPYNFRGVFFIDYARLFTWIQSFLPEGAETPQPTTANSPRPIPIIEDINLNQNLTDGNRTVQTEMRAILLWIESRDLPTLVTLADRSSRIGEHWFEFQTPQVLSKSVLIDLFSMSRETRLKEIIDFIYHDSTHKFASKSLAKSISTLIMVAFDIIPPPPVIFDIKRGVPSVPRRHHERFLDSMVESFQSSKSMFLCDFILACLTDGSNAVGHIKEQWAKENSISNSNHRSVFFIDNFLQQPFIVSDSKQPKTHYLRRFLSWFRREFTSRRLAQDSICNLFREEHVTKIMKDLHELQELFWFQPGRHPRNLTMPSSYLCGHLQETGNTTFSEPLSQPVDIPQVPTNLRMSHKEVVQMMMTGGEHTDDGQRLDPSFYSDSVCFPEQVLVEPEIVNNRFVSGYVVGPPDPKRKREYQGRTTVHEYDRATRQQLISDYGEPRLFYQEAGLPMEDCFENYVSDDGKHVTRRVIDLNLPSNFTIYGVPVKQYNHQVPAISEVTPGYESISIATAQVNPREVGRKGKRRSKRGAGSKKASQESSQIPENKSNSRYAGLASFQDNFKEGPKKGSENSSGDGSQDGSQSGGKDGRKVDSIRTGARTARLRSLSWPMVKSGSQILPAVNFLDYTLPGSTEDARIMEILQANSFEFVYGSAPRPLTTALITSLYHRNPYVAAYARTIMYGSHDLNIFTSRSDAGPEYFDENGFPNQPNIGPPYVLQDNTEAFESSSAPSNMNQMTLEQLYNTVSSINNSNLSNLNNLYERASSIADIAQSVPKEINKRSLDQLYDQISDINEREQIALAKLREHTSSPDATNAVQRVLNDLNTALIPTGTDYIALQDLDSEAYTHTTSDLPIGSNQSNLGVIVDQISVTTGQIIADNLNRQSASLDATLDALDNNSSHITATDQNLSENLDTQSSFNTSNQKISDILNRQAKSLDDFMATVDNMGSRPFDVDQDSLDGLDLYSSPVTATGQNTLGKFDASDFSVTATGQSILDDLDPHCITSTAENQNILIDLDNEEAFSDIYTGQDTLATLNRGASGLDAVLAAIFATDSGPIDTDRDTLEGLHLHSSPPAYVTDQSTLNLPDTQDEASKNTETAPSFSVDKDQSNLDQSKNIESTAMANDPSFLDEMLGDIPFCPAPTVSAIFQHLIPPTDTNFDTQLISDDLLKQDQPQGISLTPPPAETGIFQYMAPIDSTASTQHILDDLLEQDQLKNISLNPPTTATGTLSALDSLEDLDLGALVTPIDQQLRDVLGIDIIEQPLTATATTKNQSMTATLIAPTQPNTGKEVQIITETPIASTQPVTGPVVSASPEIQAIRETPIAPPQPVTGTKSKITRNIFKGRPLAPIGTAAGPEKQATRNRFKGTPLAPPQAAAYTEAKAIRETLSGPPQAVADIEGQTIRNRFKETPLAPPQPTTEGQPVTGSIKRSTAKELGIIDLIKPITFEDGSPAVCDNDSSPSPPTFSDLEELQSGAGYKSPKSNVSNKKKGKRPARGLFDHFDPFTESLGDDRDDNPMISIFSRSLRVGSYKPRKFLRDNSPGGLGSDPGSGDGGPGRNHNNQSKSDSDSSFVDISLTDTEREDYELQFASISTATYHDIVDLRRKMSSITQIMRRLMSEDKVKTFNLLHQTCLVGDASPETENLLKILKSNYKLTIQHYCYYNAYIKDFELGFVFYRVVEFVDDHVWCLNDMYRDVTDDPSPYVVSKILAALLKCVSFAKALKILMDQYLEFSVYLQDPQRQKECRETLRMLFHNIAYQGQKYAGLKATFDGIRLRRQTESRNSSRI